MRNCLKRDLQDFGIFRIERGRESEFPPTEESGLQTPPTKIGNRSSLLQKNRGYKPLPQEITISFPLPLLIFIVKTTKTRTFMLPKGLRLGACCLTILIYMFKECLRVRCDHATSAIPDFKMCVYGE